MINLQLKTWGRLAYVGQSSQSLAVQIQRANFWLTMLIVLCLGGSMLALSLSEVVKTQKNANTAAVNVIGQILTAEIKNQIDSITDFASNPITWTSLTDSTGREAYLKPALAARESSKNSSPTALFDYKGRHLAGSLPNAAESARMAGLVASVLSGKQREMILASGAGVKLLVAAPVIYPYTEDVIGILTSEIDLNQLFVQNVAQKRPEGAVEILHGNQVVISTNNEQHAAYVPVVFDLPLVLNQQPANLAVLVSSTRNPWQEPVGRLLGLAIVIGGLLTLVVWRVSHQMGQRIAARLGCLASECESIAQGQATELTPDTHDDEIGVLSRTLAHALAEHRHINQHLEAVVAQKTEALTQSEGRFRGFFENNASVILQIDTRNGQIMLANQAAADFYGYSLDALMALRITDINCSPEAQSTLDMAEHQSRRALVLRHRLHSGEVRNVQVYSTPMQINQVSVLFSVVHDITDRLAAERALKISEKALMSISQGVIVTDTQGHIVSINQAFCSITGYVLDEVAGKKSDFLHGPDTSPHTVASIEQALEGGREFSEQILNYRKNGERFWNSLSISPMLNDSGAISHWIGIIRDVTERRQVHQRLKLAANVFTFAREGIMITKADSSIVEVNDAFALSTGYTQDELLGRNPRMLGSGRQDGRFFAEMWTALHHEGHWHGEIWNRRKTGEFYAAMLNISAVRNSQGEIDYFVALYNDITAKKNYEQQLVRSAHYDPLTGLANRVLLADRLNQAMAHAVRYQQLMALVYLDLDGFKAVNDAHGHEAGDIVLMTVAKRMKEAMREGDTLARVGGDEFVAILLGLDAPTDSLPIMQRMLLAASLPILLEAEVMVQVSASLGATYFEQAAPVDAEQLMKQADQTMYQAKQAGKGRIHVFDPDALAPEHQQHTAST